MAIRGVVAARETSVGAGSRELKFWRSPLQQWLQRVCRTRREVRQYEISRPDVGWALLAAESRRNGDTGTPVQGDRTKEGGQWTAGCLREQAETARRKCGRHANNAVFARQFLVKGMAVVDGGFEGMSARWLVLEKFKIFNKKKGKREGTWKKHPKNQGKKRATLACLGAGKW
jgi:hypothetical protein